MQFNLRREPRQIATGSYSVSWQVADQVRSEEVEGIDVSNSGMSVRCCMPIPIGSVVYIQKREGTLAGYAEVKSCAQRHRSYRIGLEFHSETRKSHEVSLNDNIDYYE